MNADAPAVGSLAGLRIGVPTAWFQDGVEEDITRAALDAVEILSSLGAEIREIALPLAEHSMAVVMGLIAPEATTAHEPRLRAFGAEYAQFTRQTVFLGAAISAGDYLRAQAARHAMRDQVDDVLQDVDVLIWPTTRCVAPPIDQPESWGVIQTQLSDITGHPSLTVPCGFDRSGMPIGLLMTGRMHEDLALLRAGVEYQEATTWHTRRPNIDVNVRPPNSKPYAIGRYPDHGESDRSVLIDHIVRSLRARRLPVIEDDLEGLAASLRAVTAGLAEIPDKEIMRFEPLVHQHVTVRRARE